MKAIGVCNFSAARLTDLVLASVIAPMVNQVEMNPFCQQMKLRETMAKYGIAIMAWAPFAEGQRNIFNNPAISRIADAHSRTNAQVILRFLMSEGAIVIPKSVHEERIRENAELSFTLSDSETEIIRSLDTGRAVILDTESTGQLPLGRA